MSKVIFLSTHDIRAAKWLNQSQAAEYLGVTERTIRAYIARGTLPASRIRGSRLVRIKQSNLDALLRPIPAAKSVSA